MTSIVQPVPPPAFQTPLAHTPVMERPESVASIDMHIPGAWVGTNPGTPAPIGDDMQYLGEQIKKVPATVQGYFPSKEVTSQTIANLKDKTAAAVPASVMNTAANVLPSSLQPTAGPTAADAQPPVPPSADGNPPIATTTNTVEHKSPEIQNDADIATTSTLKDKAAALLPAGALSAAAAYLPSSLNPTASPTAADAVPPSTTGQIEGKAPADVARNEDKNLSSESTWAEKILPAGALAAAGAYLPTTLNPFSTAEEPAPTPSGTHEGLNAPLPPIPSQSQPLIGSTLSPDEDVQAALSNAAKPDQYKVEVVPPANASTDDTSGNQSLIESTRAIGGTTPLSPTPKPESTNYDGKVAKGLGALGVGAGAMAVDHGLKDQKTAALDQNPGANGSRLLETNESFQHVVIPATPNAGAHEQDQFSKDIAVGGASKLDTTKKHRKDRSGSISAGEASPSSPSKGGMFGGIRKLTKKKNKGHSRETSIDDSTKADTTSAATAVVAPPSHEHSLDTQNSNSTGSGGSQSSPMKKERHVLHKDPPAPHDHTKNSTDYDAPVDIEGAGTTPSMLANPFSTGSPSSSSPTKVGFKDKIKGELMSVSGTITRDHGLKEAGEKLKKGTL